MRRPALLALVVAVVALSGCGGSPGTTTATPTTDTATPAATTTATLAGHGTTPTPTALHQLHVSNALNRSATVTVTIREERNGSVVSNGSYTLDPGETVDLADNLHAPDSFTFTVEYGAVTARGSVSAKNEEYRVTIIENGSLAVKETTSTV